MHRPMGSDRLHGRLLPVRASELPVQQRRGVELPHLPAPPMNLRREAFAAMRRVAIGIGLALVMMAAFWLVFMLFGSLTPG